VLNPALLVGVLAQFDSMELRSSASAYAIKGEGWMAGPYATARLTSNVFLQARAAAGGSSNSVQPFLTYSDNFKTSRWLASATLVGRWTFGDWQFRPSASLAYIEDNSQAYVDSLGVNIPGIRVSLGQAKVGPELSYTVMLADGTLLTPHFSAEAIWNFGGGGDASVDFGGTLTGPQEWRGRVEAGVRARLPGGIGLDLSGSYDGIGAKSYEALGGRATVRVPLN
jgi:outer membrane autotransporter protein